MSLDYQQFLAGKALLAESVGIDVDERLLHPALKPFQRALVRWALRRGRAALFEGTGLGKTLQQLVWARTVADHEHGPVLILTPLAVAEQTVAEAKKFGIPGVAYARDEDDIKSAIVVTNYERFEKFDIEEFAGIVLDESGIIKSHDGKTRAMLTEACRGTPWKLCCTATPAPNDYAELGQHAEFLDVMTAKEMLSMFFVHDGSIRANDDSAGSDGWRLKRHAARDFWRWLASWAAMVRHPRDLGLEDAGYDLPPLNMHQITVAADLKPMAGQLFPFAASTLSERIAVRRDTIDERVRAAVNLLGPTKQPVIIWCQLNKEQDAIEDVLGGECMSIYGSLSADEKVSRIQRWLAGERPVLATKAKIFGFGMNLQCCAKMIFIGASDSFESTYQAIRRCWRFGQTRPVDCYFIASELEGNVVANLRRKEIAYEAMLDAMSEHMRDLMREQVLGRTRKDASYSPMIEMELPAWMA